MKNITIQKVFLHIVLLGFCLGAVTCVADSFLDGKNAFEKGDFSKAVILYKKACDNNDLRGCVNLGDLYASGNGITQDNVQAVSLYTKACDKNEPFGCTSLGLMYEEGRGVTQDKIKAVNIYEKACQNNSAIGCSLLALMYIKGSGTNQNNSKAKEYFTKACNLGNSESCKAASIASKEYDKQGREIIRGPIYADKLYYENIHIISNTYGIIANRPIEIANVVIEARVCIQHPGYGLQIRNSDLYCNLGIEFTGNALINNHLYNNRYSGELSNRPDTF
jgi:hypothetical protein